MRQINVSQVTDLVEKLCIEANTVLAADIKSCLKMRAQKEESPLGRGILNTLIENAEIAKAECSPMCQDTGMTVVFVTMGQDVQLVGGFLEDADRKSTRLNSSH